MNKKILLIVSVVVVLALVGGGYYYWKTKIQEPAAEQAVKDIQETAGVLPAIDTGAVNPLESAQSANPYDKTNPFHNIKINPFE